MLGRCTQCQAWNSIVEERAPSASRKGGAARSFSVADAESRKPVPLDQVRSDDAARLFSGIGELDRVLGGGSALGGAVLVGGDPGIGKSTLLLQALGGYARRGHACLYITGEESQSQVASRARRIFPDVASKLSLQATTDLEEIMDGIESAQAEVVVVDSIQTMRSGELESAAGSVGQLRETASRLIEMTKRRGIVLFLIGHVTKDGTLAGPKVLEHLVDTVLTFEGDSTHAYRLVRTVKNRFGPTHEVGVFEMARDGLREVSDPSELFLRERPARSSGSVVAATAEGTRPLLVEVQALVAPAVYGAARRVATGLDGQRLSILLAVLERKADVHVLDRDVFASVAGGVHVDEPALDLAILVAVVSSLRDRPVAPDLAVFGEVGLAGEVRAVPRPAVRLAEARKLGFKRVILPKAVVARLEKGDADGLVLVGVSTVAEAMTAAFE